MPQPLHRDEQVYGPVLDFGPEAPQYVLGVIVAGTDFTAANGATRVVPGSHPWPIDREPTEAEEVPAEMAEGSAMIYYGRTVHGAGVNTTDGPRMAFIFGYSVGWLRQEENILVECRPEILDAFPERVQQLVGYQAYSPILGLGRRPGPAAAHPPGAARPGLARLDGAWWTTGRGPVAVPPA